MVLLLVFLLAIPIFLLFVIHKQKKNSVKNPPPGPHGLPIIGNLHQIDNENFHTSLCELANKHGPLMSLRLGFVRTLVVSSARVAKEVMKTHDLAFASRPYLVGQQKLSYEGLDLVFAPYNDYWREIKKVLVLHLFSSKRVQSFRPIRENEISLLIKTISSNAESSKMTNMSDLMIFLTNNIICRAAFGKRYEHDGKETRRFLKLLDEALAMMGGFFYQDYFPYTGWLDVVNGMGRKLKKSCKDMDAFYQEIIDEHLDPNRPKSDVEDFMDILLGLKRDNKISSELTWNHIKGVLMNVFVAGTDTCAATMVWAMTMMIKNPRVLKKLQEEIRTAVGNKGSVEEDDIQKLPYLKAVVKETMRMHPAAPLLVPHYTLDHCTIDGYDIAPETLVYVNAWAIGRDPEVWEKPEEFSPERFLGTSIDFKGQDFELIPFGAGRRICPGMQFGIATVELALSNLLYTFDWELPGGEEIDTTEKPGITIHKKIPLCLYAKKYNWNDNAVAKE